LKRCKTSDLVIDKNQHELCVSECQRCYDSRAVCESCIPLGHKSYIPSVRACEYCLSNGVKCIRRVVMVLTVDCEEGNKQCLLQLKDALEKGTIDHNLHLLSIFPDCPHVLKTCKASFANWYLQFNNGRGCLSIFYTLFNKSESVVRKKMKSYLPKNDYVRNRDRQDPTAVLKLCNTELCDYVHGRPGFCDPHHRSRNGKIYLNKPY
jgi:hypothetical protein